MLLRLCRGLSSAAGRADTSLLAALRKRTGYTIANCKKALEMHKNDTDKAEAWLHEQAAAMGWAKASKLAGRAALQGLVAVRCDGRRGALVELNCETDFVAKNDKFHRMIEDAAAACFHLAHTGLKGKGPVTKMELDSEQLSALQFDGRKLSEALALFIGSVGENAVLRRAHCWQVNDPGVRLAAYAHPAPPAPPAAAEPAPCAAGKFAALLAYRAPGPDDVGRELCQHIVGCSPLRVGDEELDKPAEDADDETCLIFQEYLLDPTLTVGEVLARREAQVVDYVRYACGEPLEPGVRAGELDSVQTLQ